MRVADDFSVVTVAPCVGDWAIDLWRCQEPSIVHRTEVLNVITVCRGTYHGQSAPNWNSLPAENSSGASSKKNGSGNKGSKAVEEKQVTVPLHHRIRVCGQTKEFARRQEHSCSAHPLRTSNYETGIESISPTTRPQPRFAAEMRATRVEQRNASARRPKNHEVVTENAFCSVGLCAIRQCDRKDTRTQDTQESWTQAVPWAGRKIHLALHDGRARS